MFHHDNARSHISLVTRQKLLQHGWDVLLHPRIPDLASLDFHLFRSLQNSLNGKTFASEDLIKQQTSFSQRRMGNFMNVVLGEVAREMAESHRTKRPIYHWLMFIILNKHIWKSNEKNVTKKWLFEQSNICWRADFIVYTDHKLLIYALNQDPLRSSPRQARIY